MLWILSRNCLETLLELYSCMSILRVYPENTQRIPVQYGYHKAHAGTNSQPSRNPIHPSSDRMCPEAVKTGNKRRRYYSRITPTLPSTGRLAAPEKKEEHVITHPRGRYYFIPTPPMRFTLPASDLTAAIRLIYAGSG
jgi:hypothetical protein